MSIQRLHGALAAAAILLVSAHSAVAASSDAQIILKNRSSWEIHELYINNSSSREWGPDQLEDDVIEKGGKLTLTGIACGKYDVRVVDEDGDACVIENVPLCDSTDSWTITDNDLLKCQANTDE